MALGQKMTKRKLWILCIAAGLILAVVVGTLFQRTSASSSANDDPPVTRLLVETATLENAMESSVTRTFSGVVKATRSSELGFKRSGRVEEILFRSGQLVRKGEILARLDSQQVKADLEQARASLQAAQAQLDEAVAGPRTETIQAARAQVADSEAEVKLWSARVTRHQELQKSGAVAAQEFDDSRFQLESAVNRLDRFNRQLDELLAGTRVEQIAVFRAGVAQWAATVQRLEVEVADSDLVAPYDAVVSRRDVDEGVVVPAGATVLRLVEHQAIEAWVGVPPEYLGQMQVASSHYIHVGMETYTASVRDVLPEVDLATRTQTIVFTVNSSLAGTALPLPGQMARLSLSRPDTQSGFWVPTTALSRGQRGLWALTIVAPHDQTLQRRDVELMQVDSDRVLVQGLIQSGERYVTTGMHRLTPGQRIQTTDGPAAGR